MYFLWGNNKFILNTNHFHFNAWPTHSLPWPTCTHHSSRCKRQSCGSKPRSSPTLECRCPPCSGMFWKHICSSRHQRFAQYRRGCRFLLRLPLRREHIFRRPARSRICRLCTPFCIRRSILSRFFPWRRRKRIRRSCQQKAESQQSWRTFQCWRLHNLKHIRGRFICSRRTICCNVYPWRPHKRILGNKW